MQLFRLMFKEVTDRTSWGPLLVARECGTEQDVLASHMVRVGCM
jgi:hypothetical protein